MATPAPIKHINSDHNQVHASLAKHVAVVVLSYNSTADLVVSVPQLAQQKGVKVTLIIVDNASKQDSLNQAKTWLKNWRPDAVVGSTAAIDKWVGDHPEAATAHGCIYFILHDENRGYSAGNNVGIRLADALGVGNCQGSCRLPRCHTACSN